MSIRGPLTMLKPLCAILLCSSVVPPLARASNHHLPTPPIAQERAQAPAAASLPASVANAVFQDIETRWNIDPTQINVLQAEPRLWSDGCLGLAPPGEFCQEVLVMGWQITVAHNRQQWVYRSNNSGALVLWDQAGSRLDSLFTRQSKPIDAAWQPAQLSKKVVFSVTKGSSKASNTQPETLLLKDGRILKRKDVQAPLTEEQPVAQVSPETAKMFRTMLKQQRFHQFDGLCYLANNAPAETSRIFLRSRKTTVCYTDFHTTQLPLALQSVIQAWNELKQP